MKNARPVRETTKQVLHRMNRFILESKDSECTKWLGTVRRGYGQISYRGRLWQPTRLLYTLLHGEIPNGLEVMHTCDNPECLNPDHLELGTHKENMSDMAKKGRAGPLGVVE